MAIPSSIYDNSGSNEISLSLWSVGWTIPVVQSLYIHRNEFKFTRVDWILFFYTIMAVWIYNKAVMVEATLIVLLCQL